MVETVIKWDRPQMVGDYYEPYVATVEGALEALEAVFPGINRGGYACRREHFAKIPGYIHGMKYIKYDPRWEWVRW